MSIKEFIEKVIEGGDDLCGLYTNDEGLGYPTWKYNPEHRTIDFRQTRFGFAMSPVSAKFHVPIEKILLDPLAWQAVGKVEGWTTSRRCPCCNQLWDDVVILGVDHMPSWKFEMHRMINALAEEKSIEEFLAIL